MIEEQGRVIHSAAGRAEVQVTRRSACGQCGAAGCAGATLAGLFKARPLVLAVDDPLGTAPGDAVVLGLDEGALVRAAALAYLLPLAALMLAALAAGALGLGDGATLLAALTGLGAGVPLTRALGRGGCRPMLLRRAGLAVPLPLPLSGALTQSPYPRRGVSQ
jgi:sigma-E factor negative regulatory protein RseC